MRLTGILCARGIEITVRLLCGSNDVEHGVDVGHEFLVRIGLQDITGSLDGLVRVGVVEGKPTHLEGLGGVFHVRRGIDEIGVTARFLTFGEGQGDGHVAAGLQPLSPKSARCDFHLSEGNGGDGIAVSGVFLGMRASERQAGHEGDDCLSHFHCQMVVGVVVSRGRRVSHLEFPAKLIIIFRKWRKNWAD